MQIDLLGWGDEFHGPPEWPHGEVALLPKAVAAGAQVLKDVAATSSSEYLLLWSAMRPLPNPSIFFELADQGIDAAHAGLQQGMGDVFGDLRYVKHDWSMINAEPNKSSSSWRLGLDACLVRRDLLLRIGGLDAAYSSTAAAGLDLGFRIMYAGALIEYSPALLSGRERTQEPPPRDLYVFLLRNYGKQWARYAAVRRSLLSGAFVRQRRALLEATKACSTVPAPNPKSVSYGGPARLNPTDVNVSVVIPTLGRYAYLTNALESLRRQTVKPSEVVVVDQNPAGCRRPEIYKEFSDLNIRVLWQEEQGQSLARNAGLEAVSEPYTFFFDDDSVAQDDLIETHLAFLADGRYDVSTGVSFPPPPENYELPSEFRRHRIAQTFDTGNSLLPTYLARTFGGFDRNYDFGPGTDADFGTRLYLNGVRILHNPSAIRIHYKAPIGGLRVHGSHKTNTDLGLLAPFPPVTQVYYGLRYMDSRQRFENVLVKWFTSKIARDVRGAHRFEGEIKAVVRLTAGLILLPIKWWRSYRRARALLRSGVKLGSFGTGGNHPVDARVAGKPAREVTEKS